MNRISWNDWLLEPISVRPEGGLAPRATILRRFVEDGLVPFLHGRGYRLACTVAEFRSVLATGLYENEGLSCLESHWDFGVKNTDYLPEEKMHFYDVLDSEAWDAFWESWGDWADVTLTAFRGQDRRNDIQEACWSQLNLEDSPQTKVVLELLGIDDAALAAAAGPQKGRAGGGGAAPPARQGRSRGRTHEDTYIREAAESGEYGGYRR